MKKTVILLTLLLPMLLWAQPVGQHSVYGINAYGVTPEVVYAISSIEGTPVQTQPGFTSYLMHIPKWVYDGGVYYRRLQDVPIPTYDEVLKNPSLNAAFFKEWLLQIHYDLVREYVVAKRGYLPKAEHIWGAWKVGTKRFGSKYNYDIFQMGEFTVNGLRVRSAALVPIELRKPKPSPPPPLPR